MTKNQILALSIGVLSVGVVGCGNDNGFKRTSDGLVYQMIKDEPGEEHPAIGDMLTMHVDIKVGDSTLFSSAKMNGGKAIEFPYTKGNFKSDWPTGIALLTEGDSAIFYLPADTVKKYAQGQFPDFIKEGDTFTYAVSLVSFINPNVQKEAQLKVDDDKLNQYFAENNLQPQKTESGLYYIIDKEGTGDVIGSNGKMTSVNYTGTTLDGKPFDSNVDPSFGHVEPFVVPIGKGAVIPGWDEGVALLKNGSKARFFIPSTLAYGKQAPPSIGPDACLIFDVEITKVEAPAAAPVQ